LFNAQSHGIVANRHSAQQQVANQGADQKAGNWKKAGIFNSLKKKGSIFKRLREIFIFIFLVYYFKFKIILI
jgi:hypothetical protein